jgi:hypothetical protein
MPDLTSWSTSGFDVSYGATGPQMDYRLSPSYRKPNLIRFFLFGVLAGVLGLTAAHARFDDGVLPPLLVLASAAAAYNGIAFLWRGRFRTRLTTQGVEVRGYFNHFVPWSDISGFEVGGYGESASLGTSFDRRVGRRYSKASPTSGVRARLGTVHVVLTSGRRMMLRAPLVTAWAPDPYFEQKTRQMQELSRQHGTRPSLGQ